MPTTPPPTPKPATAVGYACAAPEDASTDLFTAWCERRAAADGWTLTGMVTDTDDLVPLPERPGWQHVTDLAATGTLVAVITVTRPMIGRTTRDWVRVCDHLAGLGVTLTTIGAASRTAPEHTR
ncbi:hypothetical protein [Kitasatospora purpeofusca]|uniref:hypothetical protein n=1 Tax=Kitasatospora purpeofusca TaxID=67352 RepID=UPI0038172131